MTDSRKMKRGSYQFQEIERRWRERWLEEKTFKTHGPGEDCTTDARPKCYVLDMFPYPSGDGLHIGHPKGYIASDIYSRFKRMRGFNVLHPMGFDSFGLPAEQYAIANNVHPSTAIRECIDHMRGQLQALGLAYDWDRELATSDAEYYRWTQWIFLQLYDCWFDLEAVQLDAAGREIKGKAVPIRELEEAFAFGRRALSDRDLETLASLSGRQTGSGSNSGWSELTEAGRAAVLNNYRLAYQKEVTVNWCPGLGTVLANEEVTGEGRSEIGDFPVYKRPLRQWMLRITDYADRLLHDLDTADLPDGRGGRYALDWPEPIKLMQRNWIGRSEGAEILFDLLKPGSRGIATRLEVFTTRPDTLFGATFMAVAPGHPLLDPEHPGYLVPARWPEGTKEVWKKGTISGPREAVADYVAAAAEATQVAKETDEREKSGVFTGIWACNPASGAVIPVFVADYVSMEYGTGAIMAVPGHDDRDFEFAINYDLEVIKVVQAPDSAGTEEGGCFTGEGTSINSPAVGDSEFTITGLGTPQARETITSALERAGVGRFAVRYKLRDWIFSRQRYWGEPFPLATTPDDFSVATGVPVLLPGMEDFRPQTSDDPDTPVSLPLGRAADDWRFVTMDGIQCERELNVMPQWAGSCWYFVRFIDPANTQAFCDPARERHFMPVDLYIGGAEHGVLHLFYSRFWHKVLFDLGHVSSPEPFKKLFNQGMITADAFTDARGVYVDIREVELRDGRPFHSKTGEALTRSGGKMGKRYKNGLPPEEVGEEYGVDTLRLYEMYMGPLEQSTPWSMEGIRGMQRFLQRVWRNLVSRDGTARRTAPGKDEEDVALRKKLHRTMAKVTEDIEGLRLNTAIAALIELNNDLVGKEAVSEEVARSLVLMLSPFAPHLGEEVWSIWGFGDGDLSVQDWPQPQEDLLVEDTVTLPVQVNGKVRASVEVPAGITEETARDLILKLDNVRRYLPDSATPKRFVYVPGRIINIVV